MASVPAPMASPDSEEAELIVAERFGDDQPTFQGEGPSCGVPALFIRLSRCNLTCIFCDTRYTWDWTVYDPAAESRRQTIENLAVWAERVDVELVVVTGGEPLLQQRSLVPLVGRLVAAGKRVEIETNGTVVPDARLCVDGVGFNVSPKLTNSQVTRPKRVVAPALEAFAQSGRAVFKFVAASVTDLPEIAVLVDRFALAPVWILPEGATVAALLDHTRLLAGPVAARRWHLSSRLHILAFDGVRGR